jgi:SAM-dependent methyltransferase
MPAPRPDLLQGDAPSLPALSDLAMNGDIEDRAFVASLLSLRRDAEDRDQVSALYERVRATARRRHAEVRARLVDRTIGARAFLHLLREAPLAIRDHLVEEILDIAYPPLEESSLPPDGIRYCASGLAEVLFMMENAGLGPGKTFVDLGSGLGKVVLLMALLTGARAYGVEIDSPLVSHARSAARSLQLDNAHFIEGDIREVPLPPADVYYMYIPLVHSTALVERLRTLAPERGILLFSQALDLTHLPWLRPCNAASYWLEMYRRPEPWIHPEPAHRTNGRRQAGDAEP